MKGFILNFRLKRSILDIVWPTKGYLTYALLCLLYVFLLSGGICYGKEVRIISLAPNATEIIYAIGMGGSLVGVDRYSDYPDEARKVEKVGDFYSPDIEKIISLRPDYILINSDLDIDMERYLKDNRIEIIKISPRTVEDLCYEIFRLGAIFGCETRAKNIVTDIRKRLDRIRENVSDRKKPKVFVELFNDPLITGSFFIGDVIQVAGGDNIAWDVRNDAGIFSIERLIERNPDIIISVGFSEDLAFPTSIDAVRYNRIYRDIEPDIFLRPGPRIIDAIEHLNSILYEKN